ncbi:hypothetical protein [Reichenbachiella versicolor]|uniref:hypothetical protein n=1 Tax=Reichenbachiella versicolor TaxID=1821036 RepID=UPI000D6DC8DF|nr:hypothetical protein [Reichenbachiella versicolor]
MSNQLELRSTFRFSEGVNTISLPSENRTFETAFHAEKSKTVESSPSLLKKNSFAVATSISQAFYSNLGSDAKSSIASYSSKKFSSLVNKSFSSSKEFLSLKNIADKLVGFDFQQDSSYQEEVKSKFCIKKGSHAGHVILHIPAFVPQNDLNVPKGATNFKVFARLISVSDFEKSGDDYHALNRKQHGQFADFETTMQPVLRITTQPITSQLRIENKEFSPAGMSSIFVVGVKYFSYKDKKFNNLPESTKMCVMGVY